MRRSTIFWKYVAYVWHFTKYVAYLCLFVEIYCVSLALPLKFIYLYNFVYKNAKFKKKKIGKKGKNTKSDKSKVEKHKEYRAENHKKLV